MDENIFYNYESNYFPNFFYNIQISRNSSVEITIDALNYCINYFGIYFHNHKFILIFDHKSLILFNKGFYETRTMVIGICQL